MLKKEYNISEEESLIISKIDIVNNSSITNEVEYKVYSNIGELLDLSFCDSVNTDVSSPIINYDLTRANYFNALDILGAYGLTETDIKAEYLNFGDSTDSLKDGKIDAAFVVAGAPTPAVQDLATGKQVYLVSLDAEHVASLIKTSPYYKEYTIAKDVYNTPEDVTTVAVAAVVIARDDVSEAAVYNFVSSIFEDIDSIGHAKKAELDLDFAASITDVPYHPGAAKYFAEKDIEVATK